MMLKTNIRQNPYAYFFFRLVVLAVFVSALDFAAGSLLRHYYFKQQSGLLYRATYALEKTSEEILIFGSSRANHHYVSELFEKRMGQSCYNVGRDGQFIYYHYAVLKAVLKRYTPKIVILDFTQGDLRKDGRGYERLSTLFPYYKTHPELRPIAELKGPFEKWKLCSSIYPYNSSIFTIAVGNAAFNRKRREDIKGYVPLDKIWTKPITTDTVSLFEIDSVKLKYYESFIEDCVQRNVKLYIVYSPSFRKSSYADPYIAKGKEVAAKYHVDFLDYSQDTLFTNNDGKVFSDVSHLNDKGAHLFSEMLIEKLLADKK